VRLFLALALPPPLRAEVSAIQDSLRARLRGWRWTRPESIHLTLRFLGEVDDAAVSLLAPGWADAASRSDPLALRIQGLGVFPHRRRPRILWAGARAGGGDGLERLAADLELAARRGGLAPEARPFHPHLTLARAAGEAEPPGKGQDPRTGEAEVARLTLFRSVTAAAGAHHHVVDSWPLGAGA
jgi:2'-5' RNA ligase